MQRYSVNQYLIEVILAWVKSSEVAIPEIQRPFVWNSSNVRDLLDSLYKGYPIGYIILWKNPDIKLKDGSLSQGKKIIIDGQQRITALTASILGNSVLDKNYKENKIKIAFHPIEEKFEVQNSAILKDKTWLHNVSEAINGNLFEIVEKYCNDNPEFDKVKIQNSFTTLINIPKKQVGVIELSSELDIETVTEIFIRINSKGVSLSQADFVMSKIASDTDFGGMELRKAIDYFCRLTIDPKFYKHIKENDKDFAISDFFGKISWLRNENDTLYDPDYNDVIRTSFMSQFDRGKLSDLVSLLSGRNFETKSYETEIAKSSFEKLKFGVENFISETNFKRLIMILNSAGFISPKLIRSYNTLNFAYVVYLKLKNDKVNSSEIESFVKKWFVLTNLTGRYSGSSESANDYDIRQISNKGFKTFLKEIEESELSDSFWDVQLPQKLETSSSNSPQFLIFLAAQVKNNDKGFLSRDILVRDLISNKGDIHHLFPKDYLKKNGYDKSSYNQVANYVYMQTEINIRVGNKPPKEYMELVISQINNGDKSISGVTSENEIYENLEMNCIPKEMLEMDITNYEEFLNLRRKIMSHKIKNYYYSL